MNERKLRGKVINGYLDYIRQTWGKEGLEDCRTAIGISNSKIKDGNFYPNDVMLAIIKWIAENHGKERIKLAGKFTVQNLGFFSYLVRFITMETMLRKARESFEEMYQFGRVDIKIGDKEAIVTMRDVAETEYNCLGWLGAFEAMLEMTKTNGKVIHTKCEMKGEDRCEFKVEWK